MIKTDVNYLDPSVKDPWRHFDPNGSTNTTNIILDKRSVVVDSVRNYQVKPKLETTGFTYLKHQTAVKNFYNRQHVVDVYYPEILDLVQRVTGARKVSPFAAGCGSRVDTHCVRSRKQGHPIFEVHVDQTETSGARRLSQIFPEEVGSHAMIINAWRPVRGPLNDAPLLMCDATSVKPSELIPSTLKYMNLVGETYKVHYSPDHRWYYMPAMEVDDVVLFKCYDSDQSSNIRFTPHTAALDPSVKNFIMRESIEMRVLAVL